MKIYTYPCAISVPTAVALGRFDGVHTAHSKVIKSAADKKSIGLTPAVFTFCDNPNKTNSAILSTEEEKQSLIQDCGIELLINASFESVRNLSAEEFVNEVLKKNLNTKEVFCGYNYRFAKGASADVNTLRTLCEKQGIAVTCVDECTSDSTSVSSTAIRNLLNEGNLTKANKLLGRCYTLKGSVVHGNAIGRTIKTPTLNLDVPKDKLLPQFGVYACYAVIENNTYKAVANIGLKPTVGSDSPTVEVYLLNTEGDFYGKDVTLELVDFVRPEQKFENLSKLKEAIAEDINKTKTILK